MMRHRMLICLGVVLISSQWGLAAPIYLEAEATIASAGYFGDEGWQSSDTQGGAPPAEHYNPMVGDSLQWEFGAGYWFAEAGMSMLPTLMGLGSTQTNDVSATVPGLSAGVTASADGMIRFALDRPHEFSLQGDFNRTAAGGFPSELPRPDENSFLALVEIQGLTEVLRMEFQLEAETALLPVVQDGVLAPGEYTFHAQMQDNFGYAAAPAGSYSGGSSFSLALHLTPVPEPPSLVLLAAGAVRLALLRTRRRCRRIA